MLRIDKIQLVFVASEIGPDGRPSAEQTSQPITLFRASCPDVWAFADQELARVEKEAQSAPLPTTTEMPSVA